MTDAEQALAALVADLKARVERLERALGMKPVAKPRDSIELYPKFAHEK